MISKGYPDGWNLSAGSVYKDRGVWCAQVYLTEGGKKRRLHRSTRVPCNRDDNRGKARAQEALRAWRAELEAAATARRGRGADWETPFSEYVSAYIDGLEARGRAAATITGYRTYLHRLERDQALAATPLCDLDAGTLSDWETSLYGEVSGSTVTHIHVFLKGALQSAVDRGGIGENPFDHVNAPSRKRAPVNSLDLAGARKLVSLLAGCPDRRFATACLIALSTGMREGEVCGLRWSDVDGEADELHVRRAITRGRGGYVAGPPKTDGSLRSVPIAPGLEPALDAWRREYADVRSGGGMPWSDDAYVIGNPVTGAWLSPIQLGREWSSFVRTNGITGTLGEPLTFHGLRHTFATLSIAAGSDVKSASALLGHSSAAMTLDIYADSLAGAKRRSIASYSDVLFGPPDGDGTQSGTE